MCVTKYYHDCHNAQQLRLPIKYLFMKTRSNHIETMYYFFGNFKVISNGHNSIQQTKKEQTSLLPAQPITSVS